MNEALWNTLNKLRSSQMVGHDALAQFFRDEGLRFQATDLDTWTQFFAARRAGPTNYFPTWLGRIVADLCASYSPKTVCDPWAGIGLLAEVLRTASHAKTTAFTRHTEDQNVGQVLAPNLSWRLGDSLDLLEQSSERFDIMASILPMGLRPTRALTVTNAAGLSVPVKGDFASLLLVAAARRLNPVGVGLFVVLPGFFFQEASAFHQLRELGLGVTAALALPPRTFAPVTNVGAYLVVVRPQASTHMFVGALADEERTNRQVLDNMRAGREGATLELGRLVESDAFIGFGALKAAQKLRDAEQRFGSPPSKLGQVALDVSLGRSAPAFAFTHRDNAVYVPLLGTSEVVVSIDELRIKSQNYAQVVLDPNKVNAIFVAEYLNSDLGREMMEGQRGGFIPKLNKKTLLEIPVFLPTVETQRQVLALEARVVGERNVLLGLQNELAEMRRSLWWDPRSAPAVSERLDRFSHQLGGGIRKHADERLEHWFETLPFPLASILRAWQATQSQDFKTRHEHLLHFFEGTAAFVGVVLLSAFQSSEGKFQELRPKLTVALERNHQSFERATFGMWRVLGEFLGKQTRGLLATGGKPDDVRTARLLCADMFADPSLELPRVLSDVRLFDVLAKTNKYRNDWQGHGGVVGQEEARVRNDLLLAEVQRLREVMADVWAGTQLVRSLQTVPRGGRFENEVAVMIGSNSEFLKKTRTMANWLDVDHLYLSSEGATSALKLLPLVRVGASPTSAMNACYFFNRLDKGGARFVSYHFVESPELTRTDGDTESLIKMLALAPTTP